MYILIDQLEAVEAPRTGNAKRHKLGDILFIAIAAGVAGADTWYEIVEYAHTHEAFFRKYLQLPSGIPSHDTFNRVFAIMDTRILEENYQQWIKQYISLTPGDVISIDGKTIRGAGERGDSGDCKDGKTNRHTQGSGCGPRTSGRESMPGISRPVFYQCELELA